jgi:ankyrin repeat protein
VKKVGLLVLFILGFAQVIATEEDYSTMSITELNQALRTAVAKNAFGEVQKLVRAGANVNEEIFVDETLGRGEGCWAFRTCYTLLELAAISGYTDIVKELIKAGVVIHEDHNNSSEWCDAALIGASREGHVDVVRELIKAGVNVNHVDRESTALRRAAYKGHVDVVRVLIKAGVNVNHDTNGFTALGDASGEGHVDVVRELIKGGANVNYVGWTDETFLIGASRRGHVGVVRELIKGGADVNLTNKNGETALMCAIKNHHFDAVQTLLQSSQYHTGIWQLIKDSFSDCGTKPINLVDKDGNTALILAVKYVRCSYIKGDDKDYEICINSQKILKALLETQGIDLHYANKRGETAEKLLKQKSLQ